jgi:phenylacetate-CoA ligase
VSPESSAGAAGREPIESASLDELRGLQLQRLKWSLRHAYDNVPHYRRAFAGAGVHPDDLHTLEDLARFPFTTKQDLRDNYPFAMFAVPREQVVRIHASSGTTGKPTVVGYTQRDIDMWAGLIARSIRAAGGRPGDIAHVAYGYGLFTGGLGFHYGAEKLGCTVIPMSGGMTERQVQLIGDFRPTILMATPSYLLTIAEEFVRQGLDPRATSIERAICGAEPWTDAMRADIEARLDIEAVDSYGLSEVIGPGVASECVETKDGPTTKEALPVVRYRTRDLTTLLPPTARSMRRMARVTGRTDDMMIIRGVNVFPSQIEELILEQRRLAPYYVLELRREGHHDHLTVKVEADPGVAGQAEAREEAAGHLRTRIKAYIGVTVAVSVCDPGAVERSVGKAKRVIDLRAER